MPLYGLLNFNVFKRGQFWPIASRETSFIPSLNESSSSSNSENFLAASQNTLSEIFEDFVMRMHRRLLVLHNLKEKLDKINQFSKKHKIKCLVVTCI
jgi:hypothetical protein